jgi:hypothetical protein
MNMIFRELSESEGILREEKQKLEDASASIKTLKGLLPVCANCKRIRDDKGDWNHMEDSIRNHSDAKFSHGLCPDCAKRACIPN